MNNSIENAFPYICFILSIFSFWIFELKYKKTPKLDNFLLIFFTFIYLFFLGFRGFIGYDFFNYYTEYWTPLPLWGQKYFWESFFLDNYVDIGFRFYLLVVKNVWNNFSFFIVVNTVLDWIVIVYFLRRYTNNYSFSLVVFLVMGGLIFEIDFLRNFKSILFFILSLKYVDERRIVPFFALNLLGFLFHSSALIFIPFFLFIKRKINFKLYWFVFFAANILFIFQIPFLKYILIPFSNLLGEGVSLLVFRYFENDSLTSYGLSIGYIERISVSILAFHFYKRLALNSRDLINVNLLLYYIILFFLFGEVREITLRLPYLFFFSYAVIIPKIYTLIQRKINRQLFVLIIILYSCLKIYGLTGLGMYQYENILFGNYKTIEERQTEKNEIFIQYDDR